MLKELGEFSNAQIADKDLSKEQVRAEIIASVINYLTSIGLYSSSIKIELKDTGALSIVPLSLWAALLLDGVSASHDENFNGIVYETDTHIYVARAQGGVVRGKKDHTGELVFEISPIKYD